VLRGGGGLRKVIDKALIYSIIPTLVGLLVLYSKQNWYETYKNEAFKTMLSIKSVPEANSDIQKEKLQTLSIFDGPLKIDLENHLKLANGKLSVVESKNEANMPLYEVIMHYPFFSKNDILYRKCLNLRLQGLISAYYFFNKLSCVSDKSVSDVDTEIIGDNKFRVSVVTSFKTFSTAKAAIKSDLSNKEVYADFPFVIDTNVAVTKIVNARLQNNVNEKIKLLNEGYDLMEGVIHTLNNQPLRAQYITNIASTIGLMYSYNIKDVKWCDQHLDTMVQVIKNKKQFIDDNERKRLIKSFENYNINMYELHDYILNNGTKWQQLVDSLNQELINTTN